MSKVCYITKDCFKNKETYNEYLKLVKEERDKNIKKSRTKNPLNKIFNRR